MENNINKNRLIIGNLILLILLFSNCNKPHSESKRSATDESNSIEVVEEQKKLLRHVVLFKFKESASSEDVSKVINAFADLPNKISEIKGFEWGINNSPENLNKGFTHSFILTFNNEADRETYLPHPNHKAFVEIVGPVIEDVLVIDYWTDN